jgi:ABC-type multidrug transport system permease subunit
VNWWRPIDKIADWLVEELDARAQLRGGVIIFLASFVFYAYMPFSGEPPVIYFMSGLALTLTGIGIVLNGEILEKQERQEQALEDPEA